MKIVLESEKDLNKFINSRQLGNTEVIINGKLLIKVISGYKQEIEKLKSEKYIHTTNLVEDWIGENIEAIEDKSEEDIRRNCLKAVKEELDKLKAESDFPYDVNLIPYNFLYMLSDVYNLTPEAIVKKVEKDLAEIEAS